MTCTNITLERIRAEIILGSLTFVTPYIKSFSVSRSRGQLAASFSASIEVPATTVFPVHSDIVIRAGTLGNLKTIFTGTVLNISVNPSFERGTFYVVSLAGQDRFWELEGKTFSRRQRTRGASTFAAITGVSSKAPQQGVSVEKHIKSGGVSRIKGTDTNLAEHSQLVKTDNVSWDPFGAAKDPIAIDPNSTTDPTAIIDIRPKSIAISPGLSVLYKMTGVTYASTDSWAVSDPLIGTIVDNRDGTATYTQNAIGENAITFNHAASSTLTFTGKATAMAMTVHDHSELGQGGPALGVFGSD